MMKKFICFIMIFAAAFAALALTACGKKNNDSESSSAADQIPAEQDASIPYVSDFTCEYYSGDKFETLDDRNHYYGSEEEVVIKIGFTLSTEAFAAGKRKLTVKPVFSDGFEGSFVSANTSAVNSADLTAAYDADDRTAKNCTIEVKTKFKFYGGVVKIGYAYDEDDYQTTGSYNLLCGRTLKFTYDAMTDGYIVDKDAVKYSGDQNWLKQLETLAIPNTFNGKPVTGISDGMLSGCSSMKELTLPDGLIKVGKSAFYGCGALKYNENENGRYLGSENNDYLCLMGVKSKDFTKFSVNENCRVIYDYAFSECGSLFDITLPEGVTRIGANAFLGCDSLMRVYMPESIQSVDTDAFVGCGNLEYQKYTGSSFVGNISKGRKYTVLVKGEKSGRKRLRLKERCLIADEAFAGSEITELEHDLYDGELIVGDRAFKNCKRLKSVILEETEKIGNNAFEGCAALETVRLDNSLKCIGSDIFKGCDSLSNISFIGTLEEWKVLTAHLGQVSDNGKITVWCSDGKIKFDLY